MRTKAYPRKCLIRISEVFSTNIIKKSKVGDEHRSNRQKGFCLFGLTNNYNSDDNNKNNSGTKYESLDVNHHEPDLGLIART